MIGILGLAFFLEKSFPTYSNDLIYFADCFRFIEIKKQFFSTVSHNGYGLSVKGYFVLTLFIHPKTHIRLNQGYRNFLEAITLM